MTLRDDILRALRSRTQGMTDAELASRFEKRHQHVNQCCRQLASEGVIVRNDGSGVIINRLSSGSPSSDAAATPTLSTRPPAPCSSPQTEWSWEGNVQAAIVAHLAREGWRITRVADTAAQERGIDVAAERDGDVLLVEVKGWPSRFYVRGERAGKPKPTQPSLQAKHWYAQALLTALRLREKHPKHSVVMAFPDTARYRTLSSETATSLRGCGVGVWFVGESGEVTTSHQVAQP